MSRNEFAYFNFNILRSNNDTDYTVNLCARKLSYYIRVFRQQSNTCIDSRNPNSNSRNNRFFSMKEKETVHDHPSLLSFFTKLLFYRCTPPPYSPAPNSFVPLLPSTSSGTRRIRGISYLAQIQSYEYNFPREQSFIVIVNPSVNWLALSITDVAVQLRPVSPLPLFAIFLSPSFWCYHS